MVRREFSHAAPESVDLLLRKGVLPYEYIDDLQKLEQRELPAQEAFFSRLSNSGITNEDYQHAQAVWHAFGCQTLGDYVRVYLLTDVLLLADVFENFRKQSFAQFGLDPAYYISMPNYSFDAMLKMTGHRFTLMNDAEMYRMVQPAIRGGICQVSKRFARANNKYMGQLYNPNEESSFIMYAYYCTLRK